MKKRNTKLILQVSFVIMLTIITSCTSKIKINEEAVEEKLLEQEKVIAEQRRLEEEKAKAFADSIAKLPKGFQVRADRSVDTQHPPIVFDIEEARARVKPVSYSQLGKTVQYIKLSHDFSRDFFRNAKVLLTNDNIIIATLHGIACFYNDGTFKEMVCKNDNMWEQKGSFLYLNTDAYKTYRGVQGMPFSIDNKLYYRYVDNSKKQGWLMEYDMTKLQEIEMRYNVEDKQAPKPKGIRRCSADTKLSMGLIPTEMMPLDKYHWTTNKSKWESSKTGFFFTVHSFSGDTVCQLKDYDPIKNYTASAYRGVHNKMYRLNGHLHFLQNCNDTIYKFETVNRARPLYVIDFGEKKIKSSLERLHPQYSAKDKYILTDLLETNKFVFIFYTKDYACPNAAKAGTLLYNCFVYDKQDHKAYHTYVNEKPFIQKGRKGKILFPEAPNKGIINDLDYGIVTWDFKQAEDGKLYKLIKGKTIKEHIQSIPKNANVTNKELLEKIAEYSNDDDLFLMIIK